MAPHLDPGERIVREYVAEQSATARDRAENELRIREQVEGAPRRGCERCGDPYAAINPDGRCDLCGQDAKLDSAREKLSDEELYPDHFPEDGEVDVDAVR
jgi:hypothetical protein